MRLLGRHWLLPLRGSTTEDKAWLSSWTAEVVNAAWRQPTDVYSQFPNVEIRSHSVFLFWNRNRQWAIELVIAFPQQVALITKTIQRPV